MKKTIKLLDLDCGHCADKIQNAVKKIDGVTSVSVNFLGQKMVLEAPDDQFDAVLAEAKTLIKHAGCIVIEDEIKADAPAAIKLLKSAGIRKTVMLTGDADAVGKKVAGQLHLDQVYTELLPADKVDRVESLLKQKSEKGMLAFVGDGINDAPVLARADVGIAMGGLGSDAAIEAADVVLMTDEPSKIAAVMKIARKTIRIANQNIVFALGVKFLVLILGALGYANMWAAVFADVGVSIIAILNAIRAMRVKLPDMPAGSTNQG